MCDSILRQSQGPSPPLVQTLTLTLLAIDQGCCGFLSPPQSAKSGD